MNLQLDETIRLGFALGELEPYNLWRLSSFLAVPTIFERRNVMLVEAKRRYQNGELINDQSRRRTLGGCFFKQASKEEVKQAHRIRVVYRKEHKILNKKHVPSVFSLELSE